MFGFSKDIIPEGYERIAVYTAKKPIKCRKGMIKEGSKVTLEVEPFFTYCKEDEIGFTIVACDSKDSFTLRISPGNFKWLNEHFEKDEKLTRELAKFVKIKDEECLAEEKAEHKTKRISEISTAFTISMGTLILMLVKIMNIDTRIAAMCIMALAVVFYIGLIPSIWWLYFRESKSCNAICKYEEERRKILRTES